MQFLELVPRIQPSEAALHALLDSQAVPGDLAGEDLVVFCAGLWLAGDTFAAALVHEVLCERRARTIVLIGTPQDFLAQMRAAAKRCRVSDRVTQGLWYKLRSTVPPEVAAKFG